MNLPIGKCTLVRDEEFDFDNAGSLFLDGIVTTDMKTGKKHSSLRITNSAEKSYATISDEEYVECIANLQYIIQVIMPSEQEDGVSFHYTTKEGLTFGVEVSQGLLKESWGFYVLVDKDDKQRITMDKKAASNLLSAFAQMYKETNMK